MSIALHPVEHLSESRSRELPLSVTHKKQMYIVRVEVLKFNLTADVSTTPNISAVSYQTRPTNLSDGE